MTAHEEWLDRLAAYALGVDPLDQRTALETHVAACRPCQDHLALYRGVTEVLEEGWAEPPRGLFQRIEARVARERLDDEARSALDGFAETLERNGLQAACGVLNGRAPHRFTGVFRLEPPCMNSVRLFDRENPSVETTDPIQLGSTYCSIILATRSPFYTADAASDERLIAHPARDEVRSYCGVPLADAAGRPFGTLCHFDVEPCPVPMEEIPLLQAAAPLVMRSVESA